MVVVAQLVRALVCGSRGRRFETAHPPQSKTQILLIKYLRFFYAQISRHTTA